MRLPIFAVLTAVGSIGVLAACVGDDPDGTNPTPTPDSGTADTSSSSSSGSTSDGGPTSDAPSNEDAAPTKRIVFVTSARYPGTFASGSNPWTAADAICTSEAAGSSLPGTFVAWISYQNEAGAPFNASGRIADAPYYLPVNAAEGGAPLLVVDSKTELLSTGPKVPISRHANGLETDTDSNAVARVWTGTNKDGNATGEDCNGFTSDADSGLETATTGNAVKYTSPTAKDWTDFGLRQCSLPARIYCFQK